MPELDRVSPGLRSARRLSVALAARPVRFYRHGWQSWSLTSWLDPNSRFPQMRDKGARARDEDPVYAADRPDVSAAVGAVDLGGGQTVLLGALAPGARVRLEGLDLIGWYENEGIGDWLIAEGSEDEVFGEYGRQLGQMLGRREPGPPPRVWCSWYSLSKFISERNLLPQLRALKDVPFDVFQIDDGWQQGHSEWEPNRKFRSGMACIARRIRDSGMRAGLWLAPLLVSGDAAVTRAHADWVLRGNDGNPVRAGLTWAGRPLILDCSNSGVLDWLADQIQKVREWGFDYLKLDYLYVGALPGRRAREMDRETCYREALQRMREAAGDAYVLASGAPIVPSLGLADGLRVGPDVAPYWINTPLSRWLDNPSDPGVQNAIRTSLHRLWLKPLVHLDVDASYFAPRKGGLGPTQLQMHTDLGILADSRCTSELWDTLAGEERQGLREHLTSTHVTKRDSRYRYRIGTRRVDFTEAVAIAAPVRWPVWLALPLGLALVLVHQIVPALLASLRRSSETVGD